MLECEPNEQDILEKSPRTLRGRGGSNNFGNNRSELVKTEEDRKLVQGLLNEVLEVYRMPRVTSDEELTQRLDDYFTACAQRGQIPTVEEMAMCTGYSQATIWDWENGRNKGFSSRTSELIKKSKEFLKTFDAKLVISGKLNFLVYCFRSKNYYGMVDKVEHVVSPGDPLGELKSPEELAKRYIEGIPSSDFDGDPNA